MQLTYEDQAFLGDPVGEKLLQLWSHGQKWDASVLGVIDADSYTDEVRESLAE